MKNSFRKKTIRRGKKRVSGGTLMRTIKNIGKTIKSFIRRPTGVVIDRTPPPSIRSSNRSRSNSSNRSNRSRSNSSKSNSSSGDSFLKKQYGSDYLDEFESEKSEKSK